MPVIYINLGAAVLILLGALVGLLPLLLGRYYGRPGLGKLGMLCCTFSGLLPGLQIAVAAGFVLAILIKKTDFIWPQRSAAIHMTAQKTPAAPTAAEASAPPVRPAAPADFQLPSR